MVPDNKKTTVNVLVLPTYLKYYMTRDFYLLKILSEITNHIKRNSTNTTDIDEYRIFATFTNKVTS